MTAMSAWNPKDRKWMSSRRKSWNAVKEKIARMAFAKGKALSLLKQYYLTGSVKRDDYFQLFWKEPEPERPLNGLEGCVFLECWLSADASEQNFRNIRRAYGDSTYSPALESSRHMFLRGMAHILLASERLRFGVDPFFDGLEERLYKVLCEDILSREAYPHLNDTAFEKRIVRASIFEISHQIPSYLNLEREDFDHTVLYRLDEFRTAIKLSPDQVEPRQWNTLVSVVDAMVSQPVLYPPKLVEFGVRVKDVIDDPTLPASVRDLVSEARNAAEGGRNSLFAGAELTLFTRFASKDVRDMFESYARPEYLKEYYNGKAAGDEINRYAGLVRCRRTPVLVKEIADDGLVLRYKMGVLGWEDFQMLVHSLFDRSNDGHFGARVKCAAVYAHHDKEPKTFYRVSEEGELEPIYELNAGGEMDGAIARLSDVAEVLPYVARHEILDTH